MGTSPNRSYPYPAGSDPVDVPGDLESLADAVDADVEALESRTITAGTGLTGGGDLSANRTLSVDTGGIDTAKLADGAVTLAKTSGIAPIIVGFKPSTTDDYVAPMGVTVGTRVVVNNVPYLTPIFLWGGTLDRIGIEVTTASGAGGVVRLGIYPANTSGRVTDAPVIDAGTVAADTTGVKEITISQAVTTGYYFLAVVAQGGAGNPVVRAITASQQQSVSASAADVSSGAANFTALQVTAGFAGSGALGTPANTTRTNVPPRPFVRYSAVT